MSVSNIRVTVFKKLMKSNFLIPQLIPKICIAEICDPGFVSLIAYLIVFFFFCNLNNLNKVTFAAQKMKFSVKGCS